jgi:DNA-binding MarR family transcriptional regulator
MITSGAMTVCLNRLERAGMISRRVSPDDRRVRIIRLTPKGRQLIDKVLTARFGDAKEILSHLSGKEIASLNTLLRSAVSKT